MNLGTAVGYLELDTSKFQSGLKTAQSQFKGFMDTSQSASDRFIGLGNSMKTVGSNLSKYVTLPLAGIGAAAVKTTTDFQAGMSEVQAISGATGKDLELLTEKAKEMGSTTKFSASDSADALKYMAMAGWKTQDMLKGLPAILNLAAAGGTDLAVTSDIVTDGMTAMGISIDDAGGFVDIMAATCSNANTNIELMGETLKYVGPVAGALGISMDDLSLAIGLMGNAGLKGSQAGTSLRAGLTNLIKPTEQMEKAMKKYGVEVVKTESGSVDFLGTMENLRSTLGGLDETTQAAALSTIFGKEAMSGWASIVNASEADFNKLSDAILESAGSAEKMSATMQDNLKGSIDNMKSAFEGFLIVIGEKLTPIIRDIVDNISKMFTWFNNLNPAVQDVVIAFGGLLASVGPLLLIFGNLIIFAVNLGTAIGTLTTFFGAGGAGAGILSAAIGALSGPIGIAIGAITALIAVGVLLYKNWDEIKAKCSEIWQGIKDTISNAFDWICDIIGVDSELIKTTLSETWNNIKESVSVAWDVVRQTIGKAWDSIKEIIDLTAGQIFVIVGEAWENIKDTLSMVGDAIKQLIDGDWEGAKETIRQMNEKIKEIISMAWNRIKVVLSQAGEAIKSVIQESWNKVKATISQTLDNIKTTVKNGWNKVKGDAETGWNNIKNAIKTIAKGIAGDIGDQLKKAWDTAKGWWDKIKNIFKNPIKAVVNIFKNEKSLVAPPKEEVSTYANSLRARESTVNDFANGMRARTYTMYKNSEIDFKLPTIKADKSNNSNSERPIEVNLNIDKFVNKSKEDINEIMEQITFELRRRRLSYGGAR